MKEISKKKIGPKIVEWLSRYLPAEIIAITLGVGLGFVAHVLWGNLIITAYVGTWGDNLGYYGWIIYSDVKERRRKDQKVTVRGMLKVLRNLVVEFGPGEYLDSFILRPAFIYFFVMVTESVPIGLFLGKIVANVTFYLPTVVAYEFRKKYLKD